MSAREPPDPDELVEQFPLSPEEAQAIADAMSPLQNATGVGDSVGNVLEDIPGPGPKLVGSVMRQVSTQVNLASQSAEVLARAITFYAEAQTGSVQNLFPPPYVLADQIQQDIDPAADFIRDRTDDAVDIQPPKFPPF